MVASLTERWSIPESEVIDWHEWGDEFVVRVASRAETHLLSPAAGTVLMTLLDSRSALTLEALYAKARGRREPESGGGRVMTEVEVDALQAILDDFERLGMATRQPA